VRGKRGESLDKKLWTSAAVARTDTRNEFTEEDPGYEETRSLSTAMSSDLVVNGGASGKTEQADRRERGAKTLTEPAERKADRRDQMKARELEKREERGATGGTGTS